MNISVAITLTLDPLKPFGGYSRNVTHLYSTILGHQIGLSGREAHEEINITFTLPTAWSSDDCALHGHCEQVVFTACMTLTASPGCSPSLYSHHTVFLTHTATPRSGTRSSQLPEMPTQNTRKITILSGVIRGHWKSLSCFKSQAYSDCSR